MVKFDIIYIVNKENICLRIIINIKGYRIHYKTGREDILFIERSERMKYLIKGLIITTEVVGAILIFGIFLACMVMGVGGIIVGGIIGWCADTAFILWTVSKFNKYII